MHQELDRLRKELRQRIFVGDPGGETFVTTAPERRIETLREHVAVEPDESPQAGRRPSSKKGQTNVEDYA